MTSGSEPAAPLSRLAHVTLAAALLLSSAGSMALEILAGRMLAPHVGMSLYSWTAIIAVVLGGLTAGHWIGGLRADAARRPAVEAAVALGLAGAFSALTPLWLDLLARPTAQGLDPITVILLLSSLLFLPPSLAVGVVSPILTKLALSASPAAAQGRVLGRMYALGALGAILGTLGAGFIMVSWLGVRLSVFLIAGGYTVLALSMVLVARDRASRLGVRGAALLGLIGVGLGSALAGAGPCDRESAYYCIQVDDLQNGRMRVLALDHLAHGVNDIVDPTLMHSPYTALIDQLGVERAARADGADFAAFFVGGGAYTLPRAWAARFPTAELVVAEIDPAVTETAYERLFVARDAGIEDLALDARLALERETRRFDVIVGDAFHDIAIPQHLVTDEFHALVKARLKPGGLYVINVVEAMRYPPFLLSLAETLERRFEHVALWLSADDLGPEEKRTTWVVAASDDPSGIMAQQLRARDGSGRVWLRVPTEAMINVVPKAERAVLTDDFTPVDRLMSHILLDRRLAE